MPLPLFNPVGFSNHIFLLSNEQSVNLYAFFNTGPPFLSTILYKFFSFLLIVSISIYSLLQLVFYYIDDSIILNAYLKLSI
jgi:hypothetical protein